MSSLAVTGGGMLTPKPSTFTHQDTQIFLLGISKKIKVKKKKIVESFHLNLTAVLLLKALMNY